MAALNWATKYVETLDQMWPYVLQFGALYATPNNGRFNWTGSKTIEIPTYKVGGRVDGDMDTIGAIRRNFDNNWEPKTLMRHRTWSTTLHPKQIDYTNMTATLTNLVTVYNNEEKFPDMDAYTISKLYADWAALGNAAVTTALSEANILETFDSLMVAMDNARVPGAGRILYVTPADNVLLKNAEGLVRYLDTDGRTARNVNRILRSLDEVDIQVVPPDLMQTVYDFTSGWEVGSAAKQVHMFLVHPLSVITPIHYEFAQADPPSAGSTGKWVYFEESFEDVFILNQKASGLAFVIDA